MINRLNETIRKQQTRRNTYMKNVTKILTVVVLCGAMFASTQRTDALGGSQFWPGDESNIASFPAQVNSHAYVQLSGVGASSTSGVSNDTGNVPFLVSITIPPYRSVCANISPRVHLEDRKS